MTELLLRTRVLPCCPDEARLQRPRLLEMLRAQPHARLVVISAPGGYGKSTLVYDALRDIGQPFGWYNVHSDDRDPRSFSAYFLEAIHRAFPEAIPRTHELLASPETTPPQRLLTLALNEMVDCEATVRVVIDDVHLVASEPGVKELLQLLITSAPESLRLYVTSREPMDLPLARLQAQGVAILIGAEHLLFSPAEIECLFRETWGQPLEPAVLSALAERSAGWITALVLLRLALRQSTASEAKTLLASFEHNRDALFAYLSEEVLQRQPPEHVRFLLETSLLEQLDAESVAAATDDEASGEILTHLERAGLFLIRLEGHDRAFRYHHLFGQFLQRTLRETVGEDALRTRHGRLARWYEARDPMAALTHFGKAGDWAAASVLLERAGPAWLQAGRIGPVSAAIRCLPAEILVGSPRLRVLAGSIAEMEGDWIDAMAHYEGALQHYRERGDRGGVADALERCAVCIMRYGDWERTDRFIQEASRWCPQDDLGLLARIRVWQGVCQLHTGRDFEGAYILIREGYRLAHASAEPESIGYACIAYGFSVHLTRGTFSAGVRILQEGVDLFEQLGNRFMAGQLMLNQTVLHFFDGDLERMRFVLERARAEVAEFGRSFVTVGLEMNQAMLALEQGNLEVCAGWLERLGRCSIPYHLRPFHLRTTLLYHGRRGSTAEGLAALEELLDVLAGPESHGMYVPECLLAVAMWHHWQGEDEQAVAYAERASKAADGGGMRFWSMKAAAFLAALEVPGWETHLATALRLTREGGFDGFWRLDFWRIGKTLRERAVALGLESDLIATLDTTAAPATPPRLEIRTLGGLQVLRDGEQVAPGTWSRRKVVQLLTLFLASPGLTVTTDQMVEALWGDAARPERARHNVRVHIGHLRDSLLPGRAARDPSPITSLKDGYRLEVGFPVVVDWLRFEELVGQGDSLARAGRHQAALDAYLEAHALYGGDFLPEEAYSDWTFPLRRELRALYERCLAEIGGMLSLQGDHQEALTWYRRLAETDPTTELHWRKVLECCRTLGDRAGALRAYQSLRDALRRDLDLEPSEETEALLGWIGPR